MSLVNLGAPPEPENSVVQLHPTDNVAIARVALGAGQEIAAGGKRFRLRQPVPVGHKVAIERIEAGSIVRRYGQTVGRAMRAIEVGEHIHTHNLAFEEPSREYDFPEKELPRPEPSARAPKFLGYQRADGRAGTRNYIAVMAASNCAAHVTDLIARSYEGEALPPNVDGVVAFSYGDGCGHAIGPDTELLQRTISGVLDHPNVSAAILVGLGCEVNRIDYYLGGAAEREGRIGAVTLQEDGGTSGTIEAARRQIGRFIERAAAEQRSEIPASKIILGLNCGGSDSFSGITANPALGYCSDLIAGFGGTAVLAETPEIVGAEHLLVRRARSRAVAEKVLGSIRSYRDYLNLFGESFNDNPSPGNKDGGLSNILEKSLGAVAKGGTSMLADAVDYAERITPGGLVFMNTPGYDPVSLAGLGAGGVNVIAFTSGRGSAIGFPTVPVIKIASNSRTFQRMRCNMDINAGRIGDGEATVETIGREILDMVLRVASGEKTTSERWGHREFVPWRIGPVM
ncbi:MAG: altronate dehydratase family protein [Bryobacteraceae bacterium]